MLVAGALGYSLVAVFVAGWIKARLGETHPRTAETLSTILFLSTLAASLLAGGLIVRS
jgi:hypothetical protein